jgi:hypothetical protein
MDSVNRPKPLFSRTLRPNGKLFFLDVYEGRIGLPYLSIVENRTDKEGNFTRIRLYLSREAIPEMRDALDEVHQFLESYVPQTQEAEQEEEQG